MRHRVWVNSRQPQTLYVAQILLYLQGGFSLLSLLLSGASLAWLIGGSLLALVYVFLATVGKLLAAYAIANERRWGYKLGVVAAAAPLALRLLSLARGGLRALYGDPVGLLFDVALLALLLHPLSRSYQRYWPSRR